MSEVYQGFPMDWALMDHWDGEPISIREAFKKTGISFIPSEHDPIAAEKMRLALLSAMTGSEYKKLPFQDRMQVLNAVVAMFREMGTPRMAVYLLLEGLGA